MSRAGPVPTTNDCEDTRRDWTIMDISVRLEIDEQTALNDATMTGRTISVQFFGTLEQNDLTACRRLVRAWRSCAGQQHEITDWLDYFDAIIIDEQSGDAALAERSYRALLDRA